MSSDKMKRIKTLFTTRSTALALILLLTTSVAITNFIPQTGAITSAVATAEGGHTVFSRLVTALGMNHVFSTRWFLLLALFFLITLILSTCDQFLLARAKTTQAPQMVNRGEPVLLGVSIASFQALLEKNGYRCLAESPDCRRYVKSAAGYWGNFLLHLGMTVTVLFALIYILTEHRVIVRLVSGETTSLLPHDYAERRGVLAGNLPLPPEIGLVRLDPEFWENDQLKALSSELLLYYQGEAPQPIQVGISAKSSSRGMTVYQQNTFGNLFLLEFRDDKAGILQQSIALPMPPHRDKAGYGNFALPGGRFTVKAKYYADTDKKGIMPVNPLLVLRLFEDDRILAETTLTNGQQRRFGPYDLKLLGVAWWTEILFEGSRGTTGIFTGFFLLLCGGGLAYFVVPREALLCRAGSGYTFYWRATRFPAFYQEEQEDLMRCCQREGEV